MTITIATCISYTSIDTADRVNMIKVEIRGLPLWKSCIIHNLVVLIAMYALIQIKKYKQV